MFALDAAQPPDLSGKTRNTVCFVGPIYPALIPTGMRAFLTLGLHNLVLVATDAIERRLLRELLNRIAGQFAWEKWDLVGHVIDQVTFGQKNVAAPFAHKKWRGQVEHQLQPAIDEYQTLLATTVNRGIAYFDNFVNDFAPFDAGFRATLKAKRSSKKKPTESSVVQQRHFSEKLSQIVSVNAALSRYSSQTFAGTSPITETECHFWTHSLLGAGIATCALTAIRDQVGYLAKVARFEARMAGCANREAPSTQIQNATLTWWAKPLEIVDGLNHDEWLPFVVFYSGRDGFKSSQFTMSVPLECVKAANTHEWSLQTITHEISHWFVERILAAFVTKEDINSISWATNILGVIVPRADAVSSPLDERTYLVALLAYGLTRLDAEHNDGIALQPPESRRLGTSPSRARETAARVPSLPYTPVVLQEVVRTHWGEIEELFAHIFDFYYFYKSDAAAYVSGIWRSWDVIPNNGGKVDQYVVRCLCALYVKNISLANSREITAQQLQHELDVLSKAAKGNQYISTAANSLRDHRGLFMERLTKRAVLIKLAKKLMCNDSVAQSLNAKGTRTSSQRSSPPNNPNVPLQFTANRQIENPLRFIDELVKDKKADSRKSAWILTQLAFATYDSR